MNRMVLVEGICKNHGTILVDHFYRSPLAVLVARVTAGGTANHKVSFVLVCDNNKRHLLRVQRGGEIVFEAIHLLKVNVSSGRNVLRSSGHASKKNRNHKANYLNTAPKAKHSGTPSAMPKA